MERRAKIVATLGPATWDSRTLKRLVRAGVDVVRLNLSHGTSEQHRATVAAVRRAAEAQEEFIPVLMDLMGPRYRLGQLAPRRLKRGERVTLGPDGNAVDLPVSPPELIRHLKRGERILIDNGLVEARIESKRGARAVARIVAGGPVATRKGINLPDTTLPFSISPKDRDDIRMAVEEGADFLAASYVGRGHDVEAIRDVTHSLGAQIPIVAKLEQARALDYLEEIAASADALMVARGDLGVEVPLHRVPVLQKKILTAGRREGKPVIVATQMLESMIERPRPTRAESSDVANAVFDGADALMLSGETSIGKHPIEAVKTMSRIIREAEDYQEDRSEEASSATLLPVEPNRRLRPVEGEAVTTTVHDDFIVADVVSASAVIAAQQIGARRIVAFSQGGFTARLVSRYRPSSPILGFTTDPVVARRMQLVWGVRPLLLGRKVRYHSEVAKTVEKRLLDGKLARPGECVVILMGEPVASRPLTNLMRIHRLPTG